MSNKKKRGKKAGKKKTQAKARPAAPKAKAKAAQTCKVTVTPVGGDPVTHVHDLANGTTLGAALNALGVSPNRKNLFVGSKSATLETVLKPGDVVGVEMRGEGS